MVATTEKHEIFETGIATIRPMHDVMDVTPMVGSITPGVGAPLVTNHKGTPDCGRYHSGGPPHVQHLRFTSH